MKERISCPRFSDRLILKKEYSDLVEYPWMTREFYSMMAYVDAMWMHYFSQLHNSELPSPLTKKLEGTERDRGGHT